MKKYLTITIAVVAVLLLGGWIFWQQYKKKIIKDGIENAISKGTNNLYYIHYDSSFVDEVNGNASFYKIALQSDSLERQLQLYDTASEPTVFNVVIDEVSIRGANIAGLLNNTSVQAKSIYIKRPVVFVIRSGNKEKRTLNSSDSMAIYEKLLGKFNNIKADEIVIEDGNLFFSDRSGLPHTALKHIAINLKQFKIDSTKDYDNIISYFIKGIVAKVKEVSVKGDKNLATFTDVEYNAPAKFIYLKNFKQVNDKAEVVFDVSNTKISDISTDAFILNQQLKAGELTSDGGMLTFYRKKRIKAELNNDDIQIDNNYFNEAQLNKVSVRNTKLVIKNRDEPSEAPFVLNNVKFNASDVQKLDSGTNIKNLIGNSKWTLSADGFSFLTDNKRYKITVGAFDIDNARTSMRVSNFSIIPTISEAAFNRSIAHQEDLYNMQFSNIVLEGIDTKKLLAQKRLEATTATLQPVFRAYRDRTIAPDQTSKIGKYPHQLLLTIDFPFSIKKVNIRNGMAYYKEKSILSKKTGTVFFKNINGTITNVSNIKDIINKSSLMVFDASASFMGLAQMHTVWKLPLNSSNGAFEVSGQVGSFNGPELNGMVEALGMTSIKSGRITRFDFNLTGTDHMAKGNSTLLYNDLKVELLKEDSGTVKKKSLMSLLTNAMVRDENPKNGETRNGEINYQRDIYKSFFNLLWKSLFAGIKKTAQKF